MGSVFAIRNDCKSRTSISLLVILFFVLGLVSTPASELEVSSFRTSALLEPGRRIEVENTFGDLRIRNSRQGDLGISAIIQNLHSHQKPPIVEIEETDYGYQIAVSHDAGEHEFNGRLDLTLLVPIDTSIVAHTDEGNVYARYEGNLRATSDSGNLTVDVTGSLDIQSDSGSVNAWINPIDFHAPQRIASGDGKIIAKLPESTDWSIHAFTRGSIDISPSTVPGGETFVDDDINHWKLDSSERRVIIESLSGSIQLLFQQSLENNVSQSSAPVYIDKDLRDLPKAQEWTSGMPIKEVPKN